MSQADLLDDEEDVDDIPEIDIEAPLELLNSVSQRLLRGEIPTNKPRLQSLFNHIQSVVNEVVEQSFDQIGEAMEILNEANNELEDNTEATDLTENFLEEFESARTFIEEGLESMQSTFFSAKNFEDLQGREEEFREAEQRIEEGIARMESCVTQAENPELFGVDQTVAAPEIETALDALANALNLLSTHLDDGDKSHLEQVLKELDYAKVAVTDALQASPEENSSEVEDDSADEEEEEG